MPLTISPAPFKRNTPRWTHRYAHYRGSGGGNTVWPGFAGAGYATHDLTAVIVPEARYPGDAGCIDGCIPVDRCRICNPSGATWLGSENNLPEPSNAGCSLAVGASDRGTRQDDSDTWARCDRLIGGWTVRNLR